MLYSESKAGHQPDHGIGLSTARPELAGIARVTPTTTMNKTSPVRCRLEHLAIARYRAQVCAPEGAFGLLAAGRRHHHTQACQAGGWRTASRRWGSPTPTTCSARSSSPTSSPMPASSRSSAAPCRSISATARKPTRLQRDRRQPAALAAGRRARAHRLRRARLSEPHEAASRAFFDPAEDEAPHIEIERLETHGAGLIALTGGPDGPIDKALREDQTGASPASG